jgi:SAM-dependent methyltransferase
MHRDPENREKKFLADMLDPAAGATLEVGCGDGRLTAYLSKLCPFLIAVEPDLHILMEARRSAAGSAYFISGAGENLPLADSCTAAVIFTLSLHHMHAARGLAEAGRVLGTGGRVLIMEPTKDSPVTRLFSLIRDESGDYERTEASIRLSGFRTLESGSFPTKWVFEDFVEMTDYIFGYYGLPHDPGKVRNMAGILGSRLSHEPLEIEDITRFWLLGK